MKLYFASDHAGFDMKAALAEIAGADGHEVVDLGPADKSRVDYPDFGAKLANALRDDVDARGVLVCGSGIGISIAANRFAHVRAANCSDVTMARLCREHNDANVIAFGERLVGMEVATEALRTFLSTPFEGGRHSGRVEKLGALC